MNEKGRAGGDLHPVKVGESWRIQTLRSPYMCPLLEADAQVFNPPGFITLTVDLDHLKDGKLNDDCCYIDVELLSVDDEVIRCKAVSGDDSGNTESYIIFEVLNDTSMIRFYRK